MKTKLLFTIAVTFLAATFTASAQVKKPIGKVPFTITKPGNYYLTKDLTVTKSDPKFGFDGIQIAANNVTIDLNGRELSTTGGRGTGINSATDVSNITIRNGVIRGFGTGVYLADNDHALIEDVRVLGSKTVGLWIVMEHAAIRRCVVRDTGGGGTSTIVKGILVERDYAIVEDCTVVGLTRDLATIAVAGIDVDHFARVRGNTVLCSLAPAALTIGIHTGVSGEIDGNTVESFAKGVELSTGVYRNNSVFTCTAEYTGGTDGGGNK
jgi:Right handed beta helix region